MKPKVYKDPEHGWTYHDTWNHIETATFDEAWESAEYHVYMRSLP